MLATFQSCLNYNLLFASPLINVLSPGYWIEATHELYAVYPSGSLTQYTWPISGTLKSCYAYLKSNSGTPVLAGNYAQIGSFDGAKWKKEGSIEH